MKTPHTLSIVLVFVYLFYPFIQLGQGLYNSNGAHLVLNNNVALVLNNTASLSNDATLTCNSATVHFVGDGNQSISGTNAINFYNLTINKTSGDVQLARNIAVSNTLYLDNNGNLDLKNYQLDLGTSGGLSNEASNHRIKATDASGNEGLGTGTIVVQRNNPSGNVANLGLDLTPTNDLGNTTITRGHQRQYGTGSYTANYGIFRYYEVVPSTYYETAFQFYYFTNELESGTHTDGHLKAYQWIRTGSAPYVDYWYPLASTNTSPHVDATTYSNIFTSFKLTLSDDDTPLPIELIEFKATCGGQSKNIQWTTCSEVNNNFFDLEAGNDAVNFDFLARIPGNGNTNQLQYYTYQDMQNTQALVYYRLKQVDFDGNYSYSPIISVNCSETITPIPKIFADNKKLLNIEFNESFNQNYQVMVSDCLGRLIYRNTINPVHETLFKIPLNTNERIFLINLFSENCNYTTKIIY